MCFRLYAVGIRQKKTTIIYELTLKAYNNSILPTNLDLSDDHRGDALQLLNRCSLQSTT